MKRAARLLALLPLAAALAACGDDVAKGPPTIHYGEDVCHRCSMIISDERFAAAAIFASGSPPVRLYDDIGDMLEDLAERPDRGSDATCYVHDANTRAWLEAGAAYFIRSESLTTPMATGIAAFATRAAAEEALKENPGALLRWTDLVGTNGSAGDHAGG